MFARIEMRAVRSMSSMEYDRVAGSKTDGVTECEQDVWTSVMVWTVGSSVVSRRKDMNMTSDQRYKDCAPGVRHRFTAGNRRYGVRYDGRHKVTRERMASSICAHVRGDIVEQSGYASININVPGGEQSMRREGG